ncbi:MAG: hypothetical protein OEY79_02900, partial [Anaplasmataceae bacterium]|nr:hypothetical protein [Anaplasmataceae bacterium]
FRHFPIGTKHYIKGRIFKHRSIAHPEKIVSQDEYPVYSLTYGISQLVLFNLLKKVLDNVANIDDWLVSDDECPKFIDAIKILHSTDLENEKKKLYCVWRMMKYYLISLN